MYCWWECKMLHCFGNNLTVPQKVNIELPYDLAISLLGIYPRELTEYVHGLGEYSSVVECLACTRPQVQSTALPKEKKRQQKYMSTQNLHKCVPSSVIQNGKKWKQPKYLSPDEQQNIIWPQKGRKYDTTRTTLALENIILSKKARQQRELNWDILS